MKYLKFISFINVTLATLIVTAAYINGLGCKYTMKYWLPNQPFGVYSTCNAGQLNVGVSTGSSTILEIDGTLFSLGEYQFMLVGDVKKIALNLTDQYPFKVNLQNNLILTSTIKRLNENWVGIFADSPLNVAFLAEIEGELNMQERW